MKKDEHESKTPARKTVGPPKPPRLTLPKPPQGPRYPKPASRSVPKLSARPNQPKPARLTMPKPPSRSPQPTAFTYADEKAAVPPLLEENCVLSISASQALLETRGLILEAEGFRVVPAMDFLQVKAACAEGGFGLAIVDHSIGANVKRAIAATVRQQRPGVEIIELCLVSPEIPDAEYHLISPEPSDLVKKLREIHEHQG
jgi:hypothetical protein